MASVAVTSAWSDPSSGLTTGKTYVVQNRATAPIQFFEGATFTEAANDADGVILMPLHSQTAGPNSMRWTFDSATSVRMRLTGAGFGGGDRIEFFPAA